MNGTCSPNAGRRTAAVSIVALALAAVVAGPVAGTVPSRATVRAGTSAGAARASPKPALGSLPISFEPNVGQAPEGVKFLTRGAPASLTGTGAVLEGGDRPVTLEFVGASARARIAGSDELPGKANYLVGCDPAFWKTDVPTYSSVRIDELYAGVDLVWYGKGRSLEYDVVLAAGVDPGTVAFRLEGAPVPDIAPDGALVAGDVRLERPVAYQEVAGARRAVACSYVTRDDGRVGFLLGDFDRSLPLVVDPEIAFSFPFADSTRDITLSGVAIDREGAVYVVGSSRPAGTGTRDAMVAKLNAAGTALEYSTTIGGSGEEQAFDIAVDVAGNAYVTGETTSNNFPATAEAFQTSFASTNASDPDAFVLKLAPAGNSLSYATYLGGAKFDHGKDIVIDGVGNAYVTGTTTSTNFPTTEPEQAGNGGLADAFMTIVNPTGTARVRSTYLGGSEGENGEGIAIDPDGNVYVVGATFSPNFPVTAGAVQTTFGDGLIDAFWAKYSPAGQRVASTYLGGSGVDLARAVAVDAGGKSYLTGETDITGFPAIGSATARGGGGNRDVFIVGLNPDGTALEFELFHGGSQYETGNGIVIDSSGLVYVAGETYSNDFPTVNATDSTFGGGLSDAFLLQCDPELPDPESIQFCTYDGDVRAEFGVDCGIGPSDEVCVASNDPDLSPNGSENDEGGVTEFTSGPSGPRPDLAIGLYVATASRFPKLLAVVCIVVSSADACGEGLAPNARFSFDVPDGFRLDSVETEGNVQVVTMPPDGESGTVSLKVDSPVSPSGSDRCFVTIEPQPGSPTQGLTELSARGSTSALECNYANNESFGALDLYRGKYQSGSRLLEFVLGTDTFAPPAIRLVNNAAPGNPPQQSPRSDGGVTGLNVYTSTQAGVQPVPANLFVSLPPGQTAVDVSTTPAGSFFVVTTVTDNGESPPSNEVGGVLPTVTKLKVSASKIVVQGTGFASGVQVFFGGLPFTTAARLKKNDTKVIQKSPLATGQSIGDFSTAYLDPGSTVLILIINANGNGVIVEYTRQLARSENRNDCTRLEFDDRGATPGRVYARCCADLRGRWPLPCRRGNRITVRDDERPNVGPPRRCLPVRRSPDRIRTEHWTGATGERVSRARRGRVADANGRPLRGRSRSRHARLRGRVPACAHRGRTRAARQGQLPRRRRSIALDDECPDLCVGSSRRAIHGRRPRLVRKGSQPRV